MSLTNSVTQNIYDTFMDGLPTEVHDKFGVDQEAFKTFLDEYLTTQLGKTKRTRKPLPKGKDGKGRVNGYILFSNLSRENVKTTNPSLKPKEVMKVLGDLWKGLSDKEKEQWNLAAIQHNEQNGLPARKLETKS